MPRKNPVPERERQVAKRLRQIRKETRLSMVAFADAIGVDTGRYSRYEYGYVPLPYTVGDKICAHFNVPQERLADGGKSVPYYVKPHAELQNAISERATFLEAYQSHLKDAISRFVATAGLSASVANFARSNAATAYEFEEMRKELLTLISDGLQNCQTHEQRIELHDEVYATVQKFAASNPGIVNFKIPRIISVTIRRAKK